MNFGLRKGAAAWLPPLLLLHCAQPLAAAEPAAGTSDHPLLAADLAEADACGRLGPGVRALDASTICFSGFIAPGVVDRAIQLVETAAGSGGEPTVLIESRGGDSLSAMRLGRVLFDHRARLVISTECSSSCANYLVPAARRIAVLPDSVIMLHGSMPRSRPDFVDMKLAARGITNDDLRRDIRPFYEFWRQYPEFYESHVRPENEYFVHIEVGENYLHRYSTLVENIRLLASDRCSPPQGIALILTEEALTRYYKGNVDYFWSPLPRGETLAPVLERIGRNFSLVFGNALFPRWISGRGLVDPRDCAADLVGSH